MNSDSTSPRRLPTVRDWMILVVAAGIGIVLVRSQRLGPGIALAFRSWWTSQRITWTELFDVALSILLWTTPLALAATWAVFAISCQPPRPSMRQLSTRAGFQAVTVVSASFLLHFLILAAWILLTSPVPHAALETWENGPHTLFLVHSPGAGVLVLINWLFLALAGRRRAHPSCLDRAGRWLGWYWITMIPCLAWLVYYHWI